MQAIGKVVWLKKSEGKFRIEYGRGRVTANLSNCLSTPRVGEEVNFWVSSDARFPYGRIFPEEIYRIKVRKKRHTCTQFEPIMFGRDEVTLECQKCFYRTTRFMSPWEKKVVQGPGSPWEILHGQRDTSFDVHQVWFDFRARFVGKDQKLLGKGAELAGSIAEWA